MELEFQLGILESKVKAKMGILAGTCLPFHILLVCNGSLTMNSVPDIALPMLLYENEWTA